jgi:hypothetical protein
MIFSANEQRCPPKERSTTFPGIRRGNLGNRSFSQALRQALAAKAWACLRNLVPGSSALQGPDFVESNGPSTKFALDAGGMFEY